MGQRAASAVAGPLDWSSVRAKVSLAEVATRLLGPAPGRRGERGRKLWWPCPFHEDANPSLAIEPGKQWWRCYGCDAKGDAIELVRRLNSGMSFAAAVEFLVGGGSGSAIGIQRRATVGRKPAPTGIPGEVALSLVEKSERALWDGAGSSALDYLRRDRGLDDATIRAARLGFTPPLDLPGKPQGIVLAWWEGGRPTAVKVRQPEGRSPKYYEVMRDGPEAFSAPGRTDAGRPLIVVEGEFDCLLLGQAVGDRARVVTLGSASGRPTPKLLGSLLGFHPWLIATDDDAAGDRAALAWPAGSRRIRPPFGKDWTEVFRHGVDLRRWWGEALDGDDSPPLFTWDEASKLRWGPAVGDPSPGIVICPLRGERRST